MGRRHRQRTKLAAPVTEYTDTSDAADASDASDPDAAVLVLRGSLSPAARREYADVLAGGLHREDARARAIELLFERLAVSWTIAGVTTERQKELLARYRVASAPEREFVLSSLRAHLKENFPELEAP